MAMAGQNGPMLAESLTLKSRYGPDHLRQRRSADYALTIVTVGRESPSQPVTDGPAKQGKYHRENRVSDTDKP
jgi:hypothetical protein